MSSRDNWERLVSAVVKKEQIWQLCHQNSITTISSDDSNAQSFSSNHLEPVSVHPQPEHLAIHVGRLQRFSLDELQAATMNFSYENILSGALNVYRGFLADGSQVAIKSYKHSRFAEIRFQRGLEINSITAHPNVLHILGFCYTPEHQLLVFPLMVNGSVPTCSRVMQEPQPPLSWSTRKGIAMGVAKGLVHLHEECDKKILHRDIKAANILLNEDFVAVVADYELGIVVEHSVTDVEDGVYGTFGNWAPEYTKTGKCSEKSDVYGYGMFLLELITGQPAFNLARLAKYEDSEVLDWVKRRYPDREWGVVPYANEATFKEILAEQLMQIALICTSYFPEDRLNMSEAVRMLENDDDLAEKWDEWYKKEETREEGYSKWIFIDDDTNVVPDELSGPR